MSLFISRIFSKTRLVSEKAPEKLSFKPIFPINLRKLFQKLKFWKNLSNMGFRLHEPAKTIIGYPAAGSWLIILILLFTASCSSDRGKEITGSSGRNVVIRNTINRIISTAPSNTEIIVDLGQAHRLVAVDVHSANIGGIPAGLPLLDFFYPDAEVIIGLQPDLIIASGHNPTGSGEDPFKLLREIGIPVVYISMSKSIENIYADIELIAGLLQAENEAQELIGSMRGQVTQLKQRTQLKQSAETAQITSRNRNKPAVYFEISAPPYMMSLGKDSFIDDMISVIGAQNIFGDQDWLVMPGAESIISLNPDVIFTNVNYIEDPITEIKSRPGFNHINAVINDRVYFIDNDSSSRPSSRIMLALNQMAQAVYQELHE